MSRSFTRSPAGGITCARSEKDDKKRWHRIYRRVCAISLGLEKELLPAIREESDPWSMAKDGKRWDGGPGEALRITQDKARRKGRSLRVRRLLQEQNGVEVVTMRDTDFFHAVDAVLDEHADALERLK
jgi:hypothetical protein